MGLVGVDPGGFEAGKGREILDAGLAGGGLVGAIVVRTVVALEPGDLILHGLFTRLVRAPDDHLEALGGVEERVVEFGLIVQLAEALEKPGKPTFFETPAWSLSMGWVSFVGLEVGDEKATGDLVEILAGLAGHGVEQVAVTHAGDLLEKWESGHGHGHGQGLRNTGRQHSEPEEGNRPGSQRGGRGWRRGGMERETQGYALGGVRAGRYAAEQHEPAHG